MTVKAASCQAFAGALMEIIMVWAGFVPFAENPETTVTKLRIAYSVLPIAGTLLALIVMWNYDLSEKRAYEIRAELEKRRGKAALTG